VKIVLSIFHGFFSRSLSIDDIRFFWVAIHNLKPQFRFFLSFSALGSLHHRAWLLVCFHC